MAQALFDQHPLEEYLQDSGEVREFVPGSSAELGLELERLDDSPLDSRGQPTPAGWRPLFLIRLFEEVISLISALYPSQSKEFVERFKYDIISSSLLSSDLPSTHSRAPRLSLPGLPGQLDHSRTSSVDHDSASSSSQPTSPQPSYLIPSSSLILFAASLKTGCTLLIIASFAMTVYTFKCIDEPFNCNDSPSLDSLRELISGVNEWESVIQEALDTIEFDGRNSPHNNSGSSSPSSPVRIALGSSLHTIQTQCDNVRHLLSALTSPSELSQLAPMYAPPSPVASTFRETRPLSFQTRNHSIIPDDRLSKRQTWNGSNAYFCRSLSPSNRTSKFQGNRRSDVSLLFHSPVSPSLTSTSAPVTPSPRPSSPGLTHNQVNDDSTADPPLFDINSTPQTTDDVVPFGTAALGLRRDRLAQSHLRAESAASTRFITPRKEPIPSLFTPIQAARHPHSLPALKLALQNALSSKRYACSHLLALRFAEEEDDGYWEDVRSVMSLLTSVFLDASARVSKALREVEQQKLRDSTPTPSLLEGKLEQPPEHSRTRNRTSGGSVSFAPLPSHFSRFILHTEAIMQALDEAKENLIECVDSVRKERERGLSSNNQSGQRRRRSRLSIRSFAEASDQEGTLSPSLQAYERLRREVGIALRECERGRERLLDVVYPAADFADEEESSGDELPGLGHDASDASDKMDPFEDDVPPVSFGQHHAEEVAIVSSSDAKDVSLGISHDLDDVTPHLLLATSAEGLPLPGAEQVFESESGNVGVSKREKSKLTREERIRLSKMRRENGGVDVHLMPENPDATKGRIEKWGPGGDVVQELKDVIWRVGEKKRKMTDVAPTASPAQPPLENYDYLRASNIPSV